VERHHDEHRLLRGSGSTGRSMIIRRRLATGVLAGVAKQFAFVAPNQRIVGDAMYFTLVGGQGLPSAKFSIVAGHVWLLEKTGAPKTCVVFGSDRDVPERWLARYGALASSVSFFILSHDGTFDRLDALQA
jgi:hypothetical protein